MIIRKTTFENLVKFLNKHYELVSLTGRAPSWETKRTRPRFAVTFDDGWKDTFEVAFPLSEQYEVPVTVFICPGLVGRSDPFWPEQAVRIWRMAVGSSDLQNRFMQLCTEAGLTGYTSSASTRIPGLEQFLEGMKRLPVEACECVLDRLKTLEGDSRPSPSLAGDARDCTMTWKHIVEMASLGAGIGSHTHRHRILTNLSIAEAEHELADSKEAIKGRLVQDFIPFSYPNGSWSAEIRDLIIRQGYPQAFTTEMGIWNADTDAWAIPRVNIWEGSVVGPMGRFSRIVFEYATFWLGYRAHTTRKENGRCEAHRRIR
jgi:peptidoglycan/xylan/chitin deacetylase (PgdA/CDA1 family)